ncbi:MAG TPA: hypothetical protein H9742_08845 [Candidatus Acetatifactor stercoripullorum]|uniref:Uncharacterized protein n=1 Tax=Candidatus Acetatifactor stercoripullorum TaxID=2838414 RepID=A0A9D1R6W7_9FIRM|nr:hypothetical protein [Candidatus Acetatifactor stercoripullorum]HIW81608.1 hypothetical protein [Candidatus Acetatifactor stercoripullorum]
MNLVVLASLILFILILSMLLSKKSRESKKAEALFWERERLADSVRRKPLDHLDYIKIPLDTFPLNLMEENPEVRECVDILKTLSTQPIVNLTGYSNTDLKLEYGTANITALSDYDQNYTVLVRTLQKWADLLWDNGFVSQAAAIMEFAVSTKTDISRTYYRLAEYYCANGQKDKISFLVQTAQSLHSANSKAIVRTLQESYP